MKEGSVLEFTDLSRLKHRRQYVFAPVEIECPFQNSHISVDNQYHLYVHPDLPLTDCQSVSTRLILLGDAFHFLPNKSNKEILQELVQLNFEDFLEKINEYLGRFVLIHITKYGIRLLHDSSATRKIFYCENDNKLWFASRPNILSDLLGIKITENVSKLAFYKSEDFRRINNANIGNTTIYDEILQLMPNHYFDINERKSKRFWPNKYLEYLPVNLIAEKCAYILKGYMSGIHSRYSTMMPITAGKDSRLLLAASKEFSDQIYFYINKEPSLSSDSPDIFIPSKLFKKLGKEFHILEADEQIDDNFKKIFYENNPYASDKYLPIIYNYFKHFPDKINLPGNMAASGFSLFRKSVNNFTAEAISTSYRMNKYDFAKQIYSQWIDDYESKAMNYNVNPINLFYWEERLANWGAQTQLEKDIAQEEFNPFNSRLLVSLFLSVPKKYILPTLHILHTKIIRILWPELLSVPINPGFKSSIKKGLTYLGLR